MAVKKPRKAVKKKTPALPASSPPVKKPVKTKKIPAKWQNRTDEGKDGLHKEETTQVKPASIRKQAVKSADDWERWGTKLGKRIERRFNDFGNEMECHGKKLEKHGDRFEKRAKSWWYGTFGPTAPFLESLLGLICIGIGILVLNLINSVLVSSFLANVSSFFYVYLPFLFMLMLFFNYLKYIRIISPKSFLLVKPLEISAGIAAALWFISWGSLIAYRSSGIDFLGSLSSWIFPNIWNTFLALLVVAYIIALIFASQITCKTGGENVSKEKRKKK